MTRLEIMVALAVAEAQAGHAWTAAWVGIQADELIREAAARTTEPTENPLPAWVKQGATFRIPGSSDILIVEVVDPERPRAIVSQYGTGTIWGACRFVDAWLCDAAGKVIL